MLILEVIKAIVLGIIEGITEWLPISSTGHMILIDELMTLNVSEEFKELFFVVVQLGAICAVPVFFSHRLWPFCGTKSAAERNETIALWFKIIVGAIPAAIFGVLLDDLLDEYLYNYITVAITLIVYGIAFIIVEKFKKNSSFRVEHVTDLSYTDALKIGAFQVLSLIPGTSRSGSTILGGMLSGVSRTASAEFSFFMAIPIMLGASGLKVLKFILDGYKATSDEIMLLGVGILVSFIVSLAAIKFLMNFVKRHSFKVFGIYRIVLGIVVLLYFIIRNI